MTLNNEKDNLDFWEDYTVIDIETTGLSPSACEIIELSAVKIRRGKIVDEFSSLIKPDGVITYFISNLTGITHDLVESAPKITNVLPEYVNFIADDLVIGHNVRFDLSFINGKLQKYFNRGFNNNYIDTMSLSRKYCKLKSNNLKSVAQHFEISTAGHHRALNDCHITNAIYTKMKNQFGPQKEIDQLTLLGEL